MLLWNLRSEGVSWRRALTHHLGFMWSPRNPACTDTVTRHIPFRLIFRRVLLLLGVAWRCPSCEVWRRQRAVLFQGHRGAETRDRGAASAAAAAASAAAVSAAAVSASAAAGGFGRSLGGALAALRVAFGSLLARRVPRRQSRGIASRVPRRVGRGRASPAVRARFALGAFPPPSPPLPSLARPPTRRLLRRLALLLCACDACGAPTTPPLLGRSRKTTRRSPSHGTSDASRRASGLPVAPAGRGDPSCTPARRTLGREKRSEPATHRSHATASIPSARVDCVHLSNLYVTSSAHAFSVGRIKI